MGWFNRATIALMMGLAACAESDTSSQAAAANVVQTAANDESETLPSADWLAGEWCYEHYEAGGEVSDENITYIFKPDGTLLYQNNSSTPVDMPGSFEIADGKLVIKPALAFFPIEAASTTESGMVLRSGAMELHWTRGSCGG